MWYFTKYGFYSVVCARQGDGGHGQPVDPTRVMVRARSRRHVEQLISRFPEQLGDGEIHTTPHTDYAHRVFLDKAVWAEVSRELVLDCDYDNFKSAASAHQPAGDAYADALHDVWETMLRLQS